MNKKIITGLMAITSAIVALTGVKFYAEQTTPNPIFTVQYYAYTENIKLTPYNEDSRYLPIINTSGKDMPTNGNTYWANTLENKGISPNGNPIGSILLNSNGSITKSPHFREIYSNRDLEYRKYSHISLFDLDSNNYRLSEVWVAREGTEHDNNNPADWRIYYLDGDESIVGTIIGSKDDYDYAIPSFDLDCPEEERIGNFQLTNDEDLADPDDEIDLDNPEHQEGDGIYYIHVTDDTVIRLVYVPIESEIEVGNTTFYDYDITDDGSTTGNETSSVNARGNGINSNINYQGKNGVHFTFGNGNSGTGMWEELFNGNPFNRANRFTYGFLSLGLVEGLNKDGTLKWSDGVAAPDIFNENTDVKGKYTYDDFSLIFKQKGDTYTLSKVLRDEEIVLDDLENFEHPRDDIAYSGIFTNSFWPLDTVKNIDPLAGGLDDNIKYKGYTAKADAPNNKHYIGNYSTNVSAPTSDDGIPHNNYFGMHMEVEFMTEENYKGPIEYAFYGDDDLFVFLSKADEDGNYTNAQLICDLGGVHSSVGEYVNLRDYVGYDSTGMWKLSIFYTERGASGSTCWMQFTLPSLHLQTVEETHYDIDIDVYNKLTSDREYDDKEKVTNIFITN